jgi:uncharacterized membrane protein
MPEEKPLPKLSMVVVLLATLAYPLAVYLGFGRIEPFWLGLVLLALMLVRAWAARDAVWLLAGVGAALLAVLGMAANSWLPLKLYPVAVNAVLLLVFAASVLRPPTVIERIARLAEPALPPAGVAYTRKVTLVWCAFFVINGGAALFTALWASNETWVLYNGLIAYVLMGALFAIEWLVRRRVKARTAAGSKYA